MRPSALQTQILKAHEHGDKAALVTLYAQAADHSQDHDEACFFLTIAYVFALEEGHALEPALHARLKKAGREE